MHVFLKNNQDDLIARCQIKVAQRPFRSATEQQLADGVPMFLDQLIRTLAAEDNDESELGARISGPSGGDSLDLSEIGVSATAHGKELLHLGYTVNQVVHDYGDLCQAITDLAFERDVPLSVASFRTLNRCLDNAIADAVTEFSFERDKQLTVVHTQAEKIRFGFLVHELRNSMHTITLAVRALEVGNIPLGGATGTILKRSLATVDQLIANAVVEIDGIAPENREIFTVASFIDEAEAAIRLDVNLNDSILEVKPVDHTLRLCANKNLLHAALANLLKNAFKYSSPKSVVYLRAYASGENVHIDVEDRCGGLFVVDLSQMFIPFKKNGDKRAGMGLGLSIARQNVEAERGTLNVRSIPNSGCIFTISIPLSKL